MLLRRAFLLAPVLPVLRSQDRELNMFGDAEAYERFMGRWSRLVASRFVEFTGLPERGRMLDVGSGTGLTRTKRTGKRFDSHSKIDGNKAATGKAILAPQRNGDRGTNVQAGACATRPEGGRPKTVLNAQDPVLLRMPLGRRSGDRGFRPPNAF
jgi:hypothetical protein